MQNEVEDIVDQIKHTNDFFEKARLMAYLQKEKKITTKKLSTFVEIKPSYVCHITRLNKLPEIVVDGYYSKLISVSHLFIIARLRNWVEMSEVYEKVLGEGLTVLKTEEIVREHLYSIKSEGEHIEKNDLYTAQLAVQKIDNELEIKVIQTRIKAKVQIEIRGSLKHTTNIIKQILSKLS